MYTLTDVRFCAEECERQSVSALGVPRMLTALSHARAWDLSNRPLSENIIFTLATVIEPVNNLGYRQIPVIIRSKEAGIKWREIPRQMELLVEAAHTLGPSEFFLQFEKIHPFLDGNGRTGVLLLNMLRRTLYSLQREPLAVSQALENL